MLNITSGWEQSYEGSEYNERLETDTYMIIGHCQLVKLALPKMISVKAFERNFRTSLLEKAATPTRYWCDIATRRYWCNPIGNPSR